jgi:hypothetical protein
MSNKVLAQVSKLFLNTNALSKVLSKQFHANTSLVLRYSKNEIINGRKLVSPLSEQKRKFNTSNDKLKSQEEVFFLHFKN